MKTTIKIDELENKYQIDEYNSLVSIASELEQYGFTNTEIISDLHERNCFYLVLNNKYKIHKDYHKNYIFTQYPHKYNRNLSSYTISEIYKKYKTNNIKVLSKKKIENELKAIDETQKEIEQKEKEYSDKIIAFKTAISQSGLEFHISKDGQSGYVLKKDIEYSYEIQQDGYIRQEIKYRGDNNLSAFINLTK